MKENNYKHKCKKCIYTFQSKLDLKIHMLQHGGTNNA